MSTLHARWSIPSIGVGKLWTAAVAACLVLVQSAPGQNVIWERQFGTNDIEVAGAAAEDGAGGWVVAGATNGELGGVHAGLYDAWIARIDGRGNRVWVRQLGTSEQDSPTAVVVGSGDRVYVGGWTYGSLGAANAGGSDAWITAYDMQGSLVWTSQIGTSAPEQMNVLVPDGDGGVFACGSTQGSLAGTSSSDADGWVARLDESGSILWIRQFGGPGFQFLQGGASDDVGGVFVAGFTTGTSLGMITGRYTPWLARIDGNGRLLFMTQPGASGRIVCGGAARDGTRGVLLSGQACQSVPSGWGVGPCAAWVARCDNMGNMLWSSTLPTDQLSQASCITADGMGGAILGGTTLGDLSQPNQGSFDAWFARFTDGGELLWVKQYGTTGIDSTMFVSPGSGSSILVGGQTDGNLFGPLGGVRDGWFARIEY